MALILIMVSKRERPSETVALNPDEVKLIEGINSNLHTKISLKDGREIETWETFDEVMAKFKKAMARLNDTNK